MLISMLLGFHLTPSLALIVGIPVPRLFIHNGRCSSIQLTAWLHANGKRGVPGIFVALGTSKESGDD